MRAHLLRTTSGAVLALLIGSMGAAVAQEALPTLPVSTTTVIAPSVPEGGDEGAIGARMVLPPLPATVVTLRPEREDVTGSISESIAPAMAGAGAPALPFDEPPPAAEAIVPPPTPAPSATTVAAPIAATPATAAVDDLNPGTLATALSTFATDLPSGESGAQLADRRVQREAIVAFYAAHGNVPLWTAGGQLTPAAQTVLRRLDRAGEDGLDVTRFAVPSSHAGDAASLGKVELGLSEAALAYARQATGSRVNVARIGGIIDLRPDVADATRVLGTVPAAADAGEALRAFNPPQPGYAALRDKLAELRHEVADTRQQQQRIPYGPVLKLGMTDTRVPLLRARFGLDIAAENPDAPPLVYDTQVVSAVAGFQRSHQLPPSGVLTIRTVAALSGGQAPGGLDNDILANMEMWRWMPREQAPDRIEVNIPDFKARVLRGNAVVHETRVVVGQPDKPTPVFVQQMRFIIVNPYWNVPLSIIKNEMMPKLTADPNYFANHGYEVVERNGTTYVRQPPGDGNALGRIKFMFPNDHAVYLHDTNSRSFFARDMRALSHGCVRVEEPFSFAEAVMRPENGWSEARIRRLIGGEERTISLPRPMPILITYFTATAGGPEGIALRNDVYGYVGKIKMALGLAGEVRTSSTRPARAAERSLGVVR